MRHYLGARAAEQLQEPGYLRDRIRNYYRLVTGADAAIGEILTELARRDLDRDTVILFTSDNGLMHGEHGILGKWWMYEESIRVPLLVMDPTMTASRRRHRIDEMVLNIDVAPTLLELAGVDAPAAMQGRSVAPLLTREGVPWREEWLYEHRFGVATGELPLIEGVRTARYKYVRYSDRGITREALYDLLHDPREERNLVEEQGEQRSLAELRDRFHRLRLDVG
jgi:arylsulfatase A-like enzyme